MHNKNVKLLFALFALSGFTGLIYESVWSHYLRLFLGAAAFAQSFVLAAFMGGMALGAWLASRWSARRPNLLATYGWIEAAIGVAALIFHELFVLLYRSFRSITSYPRWDRPSSVEIYKYALCAVLIVPQTLLLGMTFPLLSGAVIRRGPEASGHHLAMLYFTNSIGAAAGALAAAFLLLGWLGMPGTMRLAGVLNLALAAAVLFIARRAEPAPITTTPSGGAALAGTDIARLFLAGAFVTGLASFIYEIVWIRMLSLVLGSSFHAFELMLSAFITGLALGGFWIRRRIDHIADPVRFAGVVQVLMGLAALATVFVYHWSFDWMAWALGVLQHNDARVPAVQRVQPRAGLCGDAARDVPRRNDAAAVHARAAARRPRRARDRPGVRRQHPWRHRRSAHRRASADARRRAQACPGGGGARGYAARHLAAALLAGGLPAHPRAGSTAPRPACRNGHRARRHPGTRAPLFRGVPLWPGRA